MKIRIAVVSLWAENVPVAAHFYRDVIGLPFLTNHTGGRPHFDVGGTYLIIVRGQPARDLNPELHFPVVAFSVPDLEAAVQKLHFHGVELPWGVETNAAERWVMFHDPAGNLIELVEGLE